VTFWSLSFSFSFACLLHVNQLTCMRLVLPPARFPFPFSLSSLPFDSEHDDQS
jgi:hypothetical protein